MGGFKNFFQKVFSIFVGTDFPITNAVDIDDCRKGSGCLIMVYRYKNNSGKVTKRSSVYFSLITYKYIWL